MSNTDGPVARFLRGECADEFAVSALTNEEFGVLFGLMHEDDQVSAIPETEELGDLPESSSDDKPVRRIKRTKREVAEFFAKHATKRKLSSKEMAKFMESRKKKRRAYRALLKEFPSYKIPSVPNQTEIKPSVLQHQRNVWSEFCSSCNSYDLDGLQRWMERCLSPSLAFRILKSEQLPDMCGSIYLLFYIAVVLGAFPACFFDYEVAAGDAPAAEETHAHLLAWAQEAASPAFAFLLQENTSCFRLQVKFEGLRICFLSLWDVMANYMQRRLSTPRPLMGNEMHEFLHGENSIYLDFLREADESRSDGQTTLVVLMDILIENEGGLIIGCELIKCEMLSCPVLDEL
jgi:hypothetical protein